MSLAWLMNRVLMLPMDRLITSNRTWLVERITIDRRCSVLWYRVRRETIQLSWWELCLVILWV